MIVSEAQCGCKISGTVTLVMPDNRVEWIDLARAIVLVVLNHCVETIYELKTDFMQTISVQTRVFGITAFSATRLGVPIFLMITGYLLLDREYNEESCNRFWKNNWSHLFICTEFWWLIYGLFLDLHESSEFNVGIFIRNAFFMRHVGISHSWNMTTILGMYILIPFVAMALKEISLKTLIFPVLIFTAYAFILPTLNVILGRSGEPLVQNQFSLGFSGGLMVFIS